MERSFRALVVVVVFAMVGFGLGGWVGREIGRWSPSFVVSLYPAPPHLRPQNLDASEYGQGLGMVFGLLFGIAAGLFVVFIQAATDLWTTRLQSLGFKRPLD